jgi:hypothetical protein
MLCLWLGEAAKALARFVAFRRVIGVDEPEAGGSWYEN